MLIPTPRGELGESVAAALRDPAHDPRGVGATDRRDADLTLWMLHELHYGGFEDADERVEWDPRLLEVRAALEVELEERLRARFPGVVVDGDLAEAVFEMVEKFEGASVSSYVHREATAEQVLHLLQVRSVYHLKEADPSAWMLPRLSGPAQTALAELLYDEYGSGRAERLHAGLFARGIADAGLDPTYGAYLDCAPTEVLEQNNAVTMFGLHRRLRAAAMGHLAAFEATSSQPSRRMAQGLRRLEMPESMAHYYAEHVEADAVHEQLAVRAICVPMVEAEPGLQDDLFLGVFTCLDQEDRLARRLLGEWSATP
jgi:Iron-containing redox enzyme